MAMSLSYPPTLLSFGNARSVSTSFTIKKIFTPPSIWNTIPRQSLVLKTSLSNSLARTSNFLFKSGSKTSQTIWLIKFMSSVKPVHIRLFWLKWFHNWTLSSINLVISCYLKLEALKRPR